MDPHEAAYRHLVAVDNWLWNHNGAVINAATINAGVALARRACMESGGAVYRLRASDVDELHPSKLAESMLELDVSASTRRLCSWISGAAKGDAEAEAALRAETGEGSSDG